MKLLNWYKSLTGFRKAGVVMTAIMIIVFIFGPFWNFYLQHLIKKVLPDLVKKQRETNLNHL